MARDFFGIEKGLSIFAENGQSPVAQLLQGAGLPGGDAGEQDAAPLSSLYFRTDGNVYRKQANANATADWVELGSAALDELSWRSELVRAATNDTVVAGIVDPTAFSDLEGSLDGNDFAVGEYLMGDVDGVPALFEVTVVTSATSITVAAAANPISDNDTFVVQNYLPDTPAANEEQAIVHIPTAGSPAIKIADVNWGDAAFISLSASYAAASGDISNSDSVNSAIEKLDGNNDAQDSAIGISQGDTDMGTYTGSLLNDNESAKQNIQQLETEAEALRSSIGGAAGDSDMGLYSGSTLTDSTDQRTLNQELENAVESKADQTQVDEIDQNVDDLVTLSGMPENSTDLGVFPGDIISDGNTVKGALSELEAAIQGQEGDGTSAGITAITTVDSVLVDDVYGSEWELHISEDASPANVQLLKIFAGHDGHAAADATSVDDTTYGKLKLGANFNSSVSVDLDGAAGAQVMRLRVASTSAGVTVRFRRNDIKG